MCRNITFVAAVSSLIQGALCIAFGVAAMLMFDCKITPTPIQISDITTIPSPLVAFTNSFYLQYFHSKNNCIARNEPYWSTVNVTETGVVTKSYQVHGMFIGYLVENSLWFFLSILLFFGGLLKSKWLYVTYQSTQFTVMLYDAILIVIFALDFKSYKEFQGNPNTPWITKEGMLINIIVMLLIVSRFVIFFIVNITFSCLVQVFISDFSSSKAKPKKQKSAPPPVHQPRNQVGPYQQAYQQEQQFHPGPYKPSSQYPDVVSSGRHGDEIFVNPEHRYGSPRHRPPAIAAMSRQPPAHRTSFKNSEPVQQPYPYSAQNKMNDGRPPAKQLRYPDPESSSSVSSHEGPNYFNESSRRIPYAVPHYNEDRSRRQAASASNLPRANDGDSQNVRDPRISIRRESFERNVPEQLKNQRPWSYISPEELPSSPNKLNQFYNSRGAMNEVKSSSRVLPSVNEYESEEPIRQPYQQQQQPRKREYSDNKRHSYIESRQPLLPQQQDNRRRVEQTYANIEPQMKKNVRFSKRTQSLDYIETRSPLLDKTKPSGSKSTPKSNDNNKRNHNRYSKDWSSSGEELCTDEFFIVNYGNKSTTPVKKAPQRPPKPSVPLKRTPSSVSSPNLVFDPVSNTARIVFKDHPESGKQTEACRRQGKEVIHAPTCDGRSCKNFKRVYHNETSL